MSSIYEIQRRVGEIEQKAADVLRDLPPETPTGVRSQIEVIEAEARTLGASARTLRETLRPLVDG